MSNNKILLLGLMLTAGVAAFLFWPGNSSSELFGGEKTEIVMYKNPGCECCTKWGDHMMEGEFSVIEEPTPALSQIKHRNGITRELASCHTAIVGDYVVEGHVPIEDVRRLLSEKPDAIGLAVPAMPIGSPGMEVPGREADSYDVLLVHKNGETSVFSSH